MFFETIKIIPEMQVPRASSVPFIKGAICMKRYIPIFLIFCFSIALHAQEKTGLANPAIDMKGYLRIASEAAQ